MAVLDNHQEILDSHRNVLGDELESLYEIVWLIG